MNPTYRSKIISNKKKEMNLNISIKEKKLYLSCYYFVNYFITKYEKSFSLEELTTKSDYYKQFKEEKQILGEIQNNILRGNEEIIEGENLNEIKVIIHLSSNLYKSIDFILIKKEKSSEEIVEEYKKIINIYENLLQIVGMESKILVTTEHKELIKAWISPIEILKGHLLYSFNTTYPKLEKSFFGGTNFKTISNVKEFHDKCDDVCSILVICKSGEEIFGGYTPLSFDSSNNYKYDNDSFLFSFSHLKKFPKKSFESTESIWGYKKYGPCFYYDLMFVENTMNIINWENKNYLIPKNFINKDKCIRDDKNIYLESLEIYNIERVNKYNN